MDFYFFQDLLMTLSHYQSANEENSNANHSVPNSETKATCERLSV